MKKIYTIDDWVKQFEKMAVNFSYQANGTTNPEIALFVDGEINDIQDSNTEGLLPVHLRVFHTLLNRNNSYIPEEAVKKALPSIHNRPILASIIETENGEKAFHSHDMDIKEDGDIEYIERSIGIIPESCNEQLIYDEDKKKTYVECDGFIYEDYGNEAVDIIRKNGEVKVSVEICVRAFHYDSEQKCLYIDDFYINGVTCLGKEIDGTIIEEGMEGANLKMKKNFNNETIDVSVENSELEVVNNSEETVVETESQEEIVNNDIDNEPITNEETTVEETVEETEETPEESDVEEVEEDDTFEDTESRIAKLEDEVARKTSIIEDLINQVAEIRDYLVRKEREEILDDDIYSEVSQTEQFSKLRGNAEKLSADEIRTEANNILSVYNAGKTANKQSKVVKFAVKETNEPYGNLFK